MPRPRDAQQTAAPGSGLLPGLTWAGVRDLQREWMSWVCADFRCGGVVRRRGSAPTARHKQRTGARSGGCRGRRRTFPSVCLSSRHGLHCGQRGTIRTRRRTTSRRRPPASTCGGSPRRRRSGRVGCGVGVRRCRRAGATLATLAVAIARHDERLCHLEPHRPAVATTRQRQLRHGSGEGNGRSVRGQASAVR